MYKSTKDTRNTPLWNPSSQKLMNVEEDEAGKLAAFRAKFGRGWDADAEAVSGFFCFCSYLGLERLCGFGGGGWC